MVLPRFNMLPKSAVDHMVASRMKNAKHTQAEIQAYQKSLDLDEEKLVVKATTFTMKVPSVAEHLDAGSIFLAEIQNEIAADNSAGQYNQLGLRYVRSFAPWITNVEVTADDGSILVSADRPVVIRQLERLNDAADGTVVVDAFRKYVNKTQITYVGYPTTPCPVCGHEPKTESGLHTIDPFSAFFTLASQYTIKVT